MVSKKTNPAEKVIKVYAGNRENSGRKLTEGGPQWVVGIGASAGGLEAVRQLLEHIPADTGIAFIVLQHFAPARESALPELLAEVTSMPVKRVTDGTRVKSNCVYVIPDNANMTIAKDVLTLSPRSKMALTRHPIDGFLCSLAEDKHNRAIGIILSGMGSDGTLGLQAIKAKGGITFAQNEKSARYSEMPGKAIKAGYVDFELTPAQIADELVRLARHPGISTVDRIKPGMKRTGSLKSKAQLEQGLRSTRDHLQSVIRQQEHHAEELQAAIEAIQSSNEELQSLNDELMTSQAQLQAANEKLTRSNHEWLQINNDLVNLLSNIQIPIVMIGHDLRVRHFTPTARHLLNLDTADIGRPITDLTLKVRLPQLPQLLRDAMENLHSTEQQLQDQNGRWYSLRIRPYTTLEKRVEGAVIAMVDIDQLKQEADSLLRESEARFRIMADSAPMPIWVKGANGGGAFANKASLDLFGQFPAATPNFVWETFLHPDDKEQFVSSYFKAFDARTPFRCQARLQNIKGEYRWYDSLGTPRFSMSGEFLGYVGAAMDITEIKRGELHSEFINHLDLALSQITGQHESIRLMTGRLAEYLGVSRCFLWETGVAECTGSAQCIPPEFRDVLERGQTTVVNDVKADPRMRDFAARCEPLGIGAVVFVPILSEGRWEAVLTASQSQPRDWRPDEVQLMRDVATRLWLAVKRARAVEALRESEERARRVLAEQMLAGIAECDASGKFTMVNQRYCDITGWSKSELLGMRISDVTHPDDWPSNAELYRRLFEAGESFFIETRCRRKDHSEIWVHTHVSPIRKAQGKIEESVAVVIDVTSRKRAEQELAAAKDRLAADLDAMTRLQKISATFVREGGSPPLAEIVEAAVAITRADKGDMRLFDSTSEKFTLVAHRGFESPLLDFWNTEQSSGAYSAALKRGQRLIVENVTVSPSFIGTFELDVVLQAGLMALQATPVLSRSGKLLAVLATYYETPGRPEELAFRPLDLLARQAGDIIEHAQSEADLRSAYEQAEAATRAKDEFLAVVSHELRGPLTSVLGYARLLHREIDKGPAEHFVDVIERNGKAQLQLIEDLLDTARIIRGKLKLEVQPVDPADVIRTALDIARPAAQAKDIELRDVLDPFAGQITGDPARLQQVVWNLLSNAIKFTPNGGRVEVTLGRAERSVQIVVRDTGIGIDPNFLPYVFERFRQSDMSSKRRVGGLGLGLSLVKHLVELHGGSVDVKSAGRGATFTVRLPVRAVYTAPSKHGSTITTPAGAAKPLSGVRTLIVDDEQEVRTLLTLTLESLGAKTEAVSSAKEAVERLLRQEPRERFDVLIADIVMPQEDGYTLMRKVRALSAEKGGNIPAIALTAYGATEHRMRALETGFQTCAVKPVDPDELVVAIQGLIKAIDQRRIAEA